jgi:hypothetical protein
MKTLELHEARSIAATGREQANLLFQVAAGRPKRDQ